MIAFRPLLALTLFVPLVASGCYARVEGRAPHRGYDTVVATAPVRVEAYPYVVYEGTPVYYVEGRWYRRYGESWSYYREEPPYLVSRRPVTVAPPAFGYGPSRGAPPARQVAPPAHRR